jgi:DNA polymerase III subunit delta
MGKSAKAPPIVIVYGDDEHQKSAALTQALDTLLPPQVERSLALTSYDGSRTADQGGPSLAAVFEDLATLPFLADRRVVVIRESDTFITTHRDKLENYLARPSPTGTLVLECRSFPKTTRLSKAASAASGQLVQCKKLVGRALVDFVVNAARSYEKRIDPAAAARLVEMVGQDTGILATEVEKLALYAGDRPTLTEQDVTDLVGQSREEKIFAVMDAAVSGRLPEALRLWHQVLTTDPGAVYKVLGGIAFKVRQWLAAHVLLAAGSTIPEIAPKVMMWGRQRELETLLRRFSPLLLRRLLAALANLDSQAKSGTRSIETGIELMLVRLAAPAA